MRISIANPCSERLDESGFCDRCQQTVHDLSKLTRSEALELYYANDQRLCVRMTRDPNGQVEFRPEPPSALGRMVRASLVGLTMAGGASAAESCVLEIRVTDTTGAQVSKANVSLQPRSGAPILTGKTDVRGVFRQDVARGDYRVRVETSAFLTWTREITCEESSKVDAVLNNAKITVGEAVIVDPVPSPIGKLKLALKRFYRDALRT